MSSIPQVKINNNSPKRLYRRLRREIHDLDYQDVAAVLANWINRSRSYAARCLAGRDSFKPSEIRAILAELGLPESEADTLFPVLGIDKEVKAS